MNRESAYDPASDCLPYKYTSTFFSFFSFFFLSHDSHIAFGGAIIAVTVAMRSEPRTYM